MALGARFAESEFGVSVILCLIANEAEHTSNNVPYNHLSGLRSHQAPSHSLHPLDELGCLSRSACRDDTEEKVGRCSGA